MISTRKTNRHPKLVFVAVLLICSTPAFAKTPKANGSDAPVIWADPGNIRAKDLMAGPGGDATPKLPLKFLKEDKGGHNAKFDAEDAAGTKWKVKFGIEAQPETVASRLLWAIGYFANVDYFVRDLQVNDLPKKLHRGQEDVTSPDHVRNVRLQRHFEGKKTGNWSWRHNPLVGTREFNGIRVMMALLSNWDMKDENNAIYTGKEGHQHYLVTDVGTSFGASGDRWTEAQSKNNLSAYQSAQFITRKTAKHVSFGFPAYPPFLYIFDLPHYWHQFRLRWVGNNIPREDARWVGSLLSQLSEKQIYDAFRAGGYSDNEAAAFTQAVQSRIAELNRL